MAESRLLCYLSIVEETQCANAIRALDLEGAGGSGWAPERSCRAPAVEEGGAGAVCAAAVSTTEAHGDNGQRCCAGVSCDGRMS